MHVVVDSSYLRDPALRALLQHSKSHKAVLTDYVMMEAYKSGSPASFYDSMEILKSFPEQVIILKNTIVVATLCGRPSGLVRRMTHANSDVMFREFCLGLTASRTNVDIMRQMHDHSRAAQDHMDKLLKSSSTMLKGFRVVESEFTDGEIQQLRSRGKQTKAVAWKLCSLVEQLTYMLLPSVGYTRAIRPGELTNLFVFRNALCVILLALRWVRHGQPERTRLDRLRNDMVDAILVTYGTYFDCVATKDKALGELWAEASAIVGLMASRPIA